MQIHRPGNLVTPALVGQLHLTEQQNAEYVRDIVCDMVEEAILEDTTPKGPDVRVRAHHHETGEVLPLLYEGPFSFEILTRCVAYKKANHHHTHLFYKDLRYTFFNRREDWEFQAPRFFTKSVNEWETKWTEFFPNPYDVELAGSVKNYALYHALMNEVFVDVADRDGHFTKFEVRF